MTETTITITVPRPSDTVLDDLAQGLDVIESDRCTSAADRAALEPARAWLAKLREAVEA